MKELIFPAKLEESLKFESESKSTILPEDVKICCNGSCLFVKVRYESTTEDSYLIFYLFDLKTGENLFQMNNKACSNLYDKSTFNVEEASE